MRKSSSKKSFWKWIFIILLIAGIYGTFTDSEELSNASDGKKSETNMINNSSNEKQTISKQEDSDDEMDPQANLIYGDYDEVYGGYEGRTKVYLLFDFDYSVGLRVSKLGNRDGNKTYLKYFPFKGDLDNGLLIPEHVFYNESVEIRRNSDGISEYIDDYGYNNHTYKSRLLNRDVGKLTELGISESIPEDYR